MMCTFHAPRGRHLAACFIELTGLQLRLALLCKSVDEPGQRSEISLVCVDSLKGDSWIRECAVFVVQVQG
jgi:hypothetical protein